MATGKSNKWLWIVGGAIVVAGGIGAYFLLRKKYWITWLKKQWSLNLVLVD